MNCTNLTILIDLSNVVFFQNSKQGEMKYYVQMKNILEEKLPGAAIFFIADASTRYRVNDKESFEKACKAKSIIQTPAGEGADYYIIEYARENGNCIIISRDLFKDSPHRKSIIDIVVPFSIIGNRIIFSQKLTKCLESLQVILN